MTYTDPEVAGGARSSAAGTTERARHYAEPLRELAAFALLAGEAVFLVLAVLDLLFVVDGWATQFGARSQGLFGSFAGLVPIGLPLLAVVLAVFLAPRVPRARLVVLGALIEYAVSAGFGVLTFLGAFGHQLSYGTVSAVRGALEDSLRRAVWLGLLALAGLLVYRIWQGDYYVPRPKPTTFPGYPAGYGQPGHPNQPVQPSGVYVQPAYPTPAQPPPPSGHPQSPEPATAAGGWPTVPPPPMPNPPPTPGPAPTPSPLPPPRPAASTPSGQPAAQDADATQQIASPPPAEATQQIAAPPEERQPPERDSDATRPIPTVAAPAEEDPDTTQPAGG